MATSLDYSELISLKEACKLLKTHPNTLRQWDKKGILKAVRFGQRKDRHYRKGDVLRLMSQYVGEVQSSSIEQSAYGNEMRLIKAEEGLNRLSRIQVITAALLQTLTPTEVVKVIIDQGTVALKCSSSLIINYNDEKNHFEVFGFAGCSQEVVETFRSTSIETPTPWTDAFRAGDSIFIESFEECSMRYPHAARTIYKNYNQAIAAIPLLSGGQAFGVLHVSFSTPQRFTKDDTSFIMTLARQCAMALERTRLYESENTVRV
jgi:transcriptional regulator with GAF, ATPase, and Fis domain